MGKAADNKLVQRRKQMLVDKNLIFEWFDSLFEFWIAVKTDKATDNELVSKRKIKVSAQGQFVQKCNKKNQHLFSLLI